MFQFKKKKKLFLRLLCDPDFGLQIANFSSKVEMMITLFILSCVLDVDRAYMPGFLVGACCVISNRRNQYMMVS
jgi:hypothetical protein